MHVPKSKESPDQKDDSLSFEVGFLRLEEILEQLNATDVALEQSLKLYEEADQLIATLSGKLSQAEKKVEQLIKNRQGALVLDDTGAPKREDI